MTRFVFASFLCAFLLCLPGCGKHESKIAAPAAKEGGSNARVTDAQKQFLTIEPAGAAEAGEVLVLPGRVSFRPQAQSAVGAPVAGRVSSVLVRAGEVVKAGAALLTLDSADASAARASVDQSATRLAVAETQYKRQVRDAQQWRRPGGGAPGSRGEAEGGALRARSRAARVRSAGRRAGKPLHGARAR